MSKKKDIAAALLGSVTALILWITILSREKLISTPIVYTPFHGFISLWKSIQRGRIASNFIGNIVLFMPLGFLFPLVSGKQKWSLAAGTGLCFSLFIETIQLITRRGHFDPDDVILNTLGAAIGYGVYAVTHRKWSDRKDKVHYKGI